MGKSLRRPNFVGEQRVLGDPGPTRLGYLPGLARERPRGRAQAAPGIFAAAVCRWWVSVRPKPGMASRGADSASTR